MKRYEKYKPSGAEWIGEIPEHWRVKKFKHLYKSSMGATILKTDLLSEGKIPVYSATETDILFGYVDETNVILEPGDLVIPARGNSIGHVTIVNGIATCTQTTIYAKRLSDDFSDRFLYHYLKGLRELLFQFDRTAIPQITVGQIKENPVALPPPTEQTAIANYLDEKTAQIDALIEKKRKLIGLLKEERTAIINHAVTKGINPKAKLKSSGIEWLGDIPEHWEVKKLKYVAEINSTSLTEKEEDDLEIEYIDISSVNENGDINQTASYYYSDAPSRARRIIRKGDTIISTVRTYLKAIAFIDFGKDNLICSTGFAVIRPSEIIEPKFLFYLARSEKLVDRIMALSKGVSYPAIDSDDIKNLDVWFPEKEEQSAIVQHIETHTSRIDATNSKIEKEIELLQEYRTALISEVVTGKIKVV